jgi:hypothetical protein
MAPTVLFPFGTPFTDQVRVGLVAPITVAVNIWFVPACTEGALGEIVMVFGTGGGP